MKGCINVGNKKIGMGQPVFIIAEAGVNHNSSLRLAKRMVDKAKFAKVDAIKFQTFKAEKIAVPNAPKADYQKKGVFGKSQFEMLKNLELSNLEFKELFDYCKKKKIIFLSTPFDLEGAEFLYRLGVPAFKIGSGDLTNTSLLSQVGKYNRPIILSTGMSTLREVKEAVRIIYSTDNKKLILLQCTSAYPAEYKDVNLRAMATLKKEFNVPIGYSDHTLGIEISIAAAACGACIIEKHFTLDRNLPGPDHKVSLEPDGLKKMVLGIRNIERAMGSGLKTPKKSELGIKKVARKSIVAACNIPEGTKIIREMLAIKRPGTGIAPKHLNSLFNKRTKVNIKKDQILTWEKIGL